MQTLTVSLTIICVTFLSPIIFRFKTLKTPLMPPLMDEKQDKSKEDNESFLLSCR